MNLAYLLIGGNLGDRIQNLTIARSHVEKEIGNIIKSSSIYETASWGIMAQPDFLNQVILVETKFSPEKIMELVLYIENNMGRVRTHKNASRVIDIDILFFNDAIINHEGLIIPHPEIRNRKFALIPMNEIAPRYIHPVFKIRIKNLLSTSADTLDVRVLNQS
jgi:2-amino-4-hydroxy-6-hydroxymethyldihydropteridine diphosphokinase